jgi:hypothetical protein
MSKNSHVKRAQKLKKRRSQGQRSAITRNPTNGDQPQGKRLPSAQTIWRSMHLDFRMQEAVAVATRRAQPSLQQRDASKIARIEAASDVEAVLDLTPLATGLADYAWLKRMRDFGAAAAPAIVQRVNSDWMHHQPMRQHGLEEHLIGALRWCDNAQGDALSQCWDALDDYGRSLASITFGLLGARDAAERLWAFFLQTRASKDALFVGPLWGLIDLGDHRAADALIALIGDQVTYYEKYGFLSRAGDDRAVLPLLFEIIEGPDQHKADATWALTGIAHRLGADAFGAIVSGGDTGQRDEHIETFVQRILSYSEADVAHHFETFYATDASGLPGNSKPALLNR